MKISVVATVLNEEKSIGRLLRALVSQSKKPDEIIVADGESGDSTTSIVSRFKGVKLFIKKGNRSVGRNYGIKRAKNEIITVTDAGGYPKKDWLEKITAPLADREIDVVSGYYKSLARTPFEKCVTPYFLVMPDKVWRGMEFLPSSRSVAFRKSVWRKVGGYPEEFFHNEDFVFDHRLKKTNAHIFFEPDAVVWWQPPQSLSEAARKFFRFAQGDAEAGINRPKIKFIFARYLVGIVLLLFNYSVLPALPAGGLFCVLFYFLWSWKKNFRYAKIAESIFWLPAIQVVADLSVMSGFLAGKLKKPLSYINI